MYTLTHTSHLSGVHLEKSPRGAKEGEGGVRVVSSI